MSNVDSPLFRHPARIAGGLAVVEAAVAVGVSLSPNPEGALAGVGYAVMYVLPALLVATGARAHHHGLRVASGWAALVLAVLYAGVVAGNWRGYSAGEAAFAVAVNLPAALLYLAVFWALIVHRPRRTATP